MPPPEVNVEAEPPPPIVRFPPALRDGPAVKSAACPPLPTTTLPAAIARLLPRVTVVAAAAVTVNGPTGTWAVKVALLSPKISVMFWAKVEVASMLAPPAPMLRFWEPLALSTPLAIVRDRIGVVMSSVQSRVAVLSIVTSSVPAGMPDELQFPARFQEMLAPPFQSLGPAFAQSAAQSAIARARISTFLGSATRSGSPLLNLCSSVYHSSRPCPTCCKFSIGKAYLYSSVERFAFSCIARRA